MAKRPGANLFAKKSEKPIDFYKKICYYYYTKRKGENKMKTALSIIFVLYFLAQAGRYFVKWLGSEDKSDYWMNLLLTVFHGVLMFEFLDVINM